MRRVTLLAILRLPFLSSADLRQQRRESPSGLSRESIGPTPITRPALGKSAPIRASCIRESLRDTLVYAAFSKRRVPGDV